MSKLSDLKGKALGIWAKNKYYIIAGLAAFVVLIVIICCCYCKCKKMRKKKKKEAEKLKIKGAKPGKKLRRIQPGKNELKVMEELGYLKFVIRYDSVSELLMITIMEAEDVPVRDLSGYAYSYVVAKALPLHEGPMEPEYKTKLVRAGFWPTYNDSIQFKVERKDLLQQKLFLYLYEMNRWTKQDGIGQLIIALDDLGLEIGKEHVIKRKLKSYNPLMGLQVETGSVKLSIEYDSEDWTLTVNVVEADIIPLDESKEKEDSYVTITAINQDDQVMKKLKTRVRQGKLRPEFGDSLIFDIPDNLLPDVSLKIALKGKRTLKRNILIGNFTIKPQSEHWQKLLNDGYVTAVFPVTDKPKIDKD